MFKKLKITALMLSSLFTAQASALTIDGGITEVGGLDSIIGKTNLGNSGDLIEEAWAEGVLGGGSDLQFDGKIDGINGLYTLVDGEIDVYALELGLKPEYFLIKIGGGQVTYDTFLFDNADSLAYGVLDLSILLTESVYTGNKTNFTFDILRLSHITNFNDTTTVSEPGTLALLGLGLLGFAAARRRKA